jgi:DNA-binding MarR family transcriptional regulator
MSTTKHHSLTGKNIPRVGALLRRAWQHVREEIYLGVQKDGYSDINPAHFAMFRFEGIDGQRPSQLAEQMQITKQSVNDLLRDLESHGYIQLKADPDDSRARRIRLTARGRRLDKVIRREAAAAERALSSILGNEAFDQFHETLVRVVEIADSASKLRRQKPGPAKG